MERYSFDDTCFGVTERGVRIDRRIIDRPPHLGNYAWYEYAAKMIAAFESEVRREIGRTM